MDTHVTKSDNSFFLYIVALLAGAGISLALGYYALQASMDAPYWQWFEGIVGVILTSVGLGCLYLITRLSKLEISKDEVVIKSLLGLHRDTILRRDITGWIETQHTSKTGIYFKLSIYTDRNKYTLASYLYNNYHVLKAALTTGVKRNVGMQHRKDLLQLRLTSLGFLAGGLFMMGIALWAYFGNKNYEPEPLSSFTAVLVNQPEVTKGSKGSRSVHIELAQYPGFDFSITSSDYRSMYVSDYLAYARPGDTLQLEVGANDYEMKLAKTKEPSLWVKHTGYYDVNVYGLRDNEHVYLQADNSRRQSENNVVILIVFLLLGAALVIPALFGLTKKKGPVMQSDSRH